MEAPTAVGLMTIIHKYGIELTFLLQNGLYDFKNFFVWISDVFDPKYMFLACPPILYGINPVYGIKVLWTAAVSEWLNHVLKWILSGERPYWWVHENKDLWTNDTFPNIHQFSISCESGPGSPSGHVMITGASLFVCLSGILQLNKRKGRLIPMIGWSAYAVIMCLIATSRVYIAAHFPHQCVAGLISGIFLGYTLEKVSVHQLRFTTHLKIVFGALFGAIATFFCLVGLNVDPNWTLGLAIKWCSHREWVHLNTTPFFMMWRYTGTLFGLALTLSSSFYRKASRIRTNWVAALLLVILGAPISLLSANLIPTTSTHTELVYLVAFLVHAVIPFTVMGLLKYFVCVKLIRLKQD